MGKHRFKGLRDRKFTDVSAEHVQRLAEACGGVGSWEFGHPGPRRGLQATYRFRTKAQGRDFARRVHVTQGKLCEVIVSDNARTNTVVVWVAPEKRA